MALRGSTRTRWLRLCHLKLDLDGLITEDGIASIVLFQVRSGWLDQRGRDQREDFAPTHISGCDSLDYSIFKFYPDGLISEAEFNQDVGFIAPLQFWTRWPRLRHFQVLSGWLVHRGRVQRELTDAAFIFYKMKIIASLSSRSLIAPSEQWLQ